MKEPIFNQSYRELTELGFELPKNIKISAKRRVHSADSEETDDGFVINIHPGLKNEEQIHICFLHELVHISGIWEHDAEFVRSAKLVREKLGLNIMSAIAREDINHSDGNILHSILCPECKAETYFFTEETFEKYKTLKLHCVYCKNSNLILR